jgi:hypothetical protein
MLWEYGEDELAEAALRLSDDGLHQVHRLAVWHHVNDQEPERGPRLTHGRLAARAAIEYLERTSRDAKRQRRRTRPVEQGYAGAYHASLLAGEPLPSSPAKEGHFEGWDRD